MADTTNYAWERPIEGASTGSWDTILNETLEAIDGDLKLVETEAETAQASADDALAENLTFPIMLASIHAVETGPGATIGDLDRSQAGEFALPIGLSMPADLGLAQRRAMIPIPGLAVGMRIASIKARGIAPAGTSVSVQLHQYTSGDVETSLTSADLTTALATDTAIASATVVADAQYFFHIQFIRSSGVLVPALRWVQAVVERV